MNEPVADVSKLIAAFGRGDVEAGNALMTRYRPWLQLLARLQLDQRIQKRVDASDVVQQAMLEACRDFPAFRGTTEGEFRAWLRQILAHAMGRQLREHLGTKKRDMRQDVSIEQQLTQSSQRLDAILSSNDSSPSDRVIRDEQELRLAEVLERLPADYRQIVILRNVQGLSHEEAAERMGRNVGATRMLWVRALARLRHELGGGDD